jgi:hypothetical protein
VQIRRLFDLLRRRCAAPALPEPPDPPLTRALSWTPSFSNSAVLNVDGTTSTYHPGGTQDVRSPDGSCWRLAPSGVVLHAWQEPPAPQWRPPESVAATQPDGGIVVYHSDGSKELWHGGSPVARFDPSGRPVG